jgi:hypothetical protein
VAFDNEHRAILSPLEVDGSATVGVHSHLPTESSSSTWITYRLGPTESGVDRIEFG